MDPAKPARASVHSLGDITQSIPLTWSEGGSAIGALETPEERVVFRLGRDQHLVLSIDPASNAPGTQGGAVSMRASVWSKDGKLMGNLEGQPLRLASYRPAGGYQLRVSHIGRDLNSPYRLSIKPADSPPRPKAWALVALAAVAIALRMLSGSRTQRAQALGGLHFRDLS
jgi:hypothetical protein